MERPDRPRVVVTGLGAVSALGWGVGPLREGILAGDVAIGPLDVFDAAAHRTRIAAQVPDDPDLATASSRTDAFAIRAAREALRSAGLASSPLGERVGVFLGSSTGGMYEAEAFFAAVRRRPRSGARFPRLAAQQNSAPADALVRTLGTRGPVETMASACAAGAMALESALASLRAGEVDVAVAGGADGLCRLTYAGFNSLRAVDAAPSRPFRANRAGLSKGEGAGIVVLERADHARARRASVLAELAGAASSCDAHHMTAPHPEGVGAAAAIRAALADAGLSADDVDFVNAHGTGTPHNDPAEWAALRAVLGARGPDVPVTSSKAIFGHLLGASGALEAVVTILCLREGVVHPTPGAGELDPVLDLDLVTGAPRRLARCRTALSTSLAFGGANAALVLRAAAEAA